MNDTKAKILCAARRLFAQHGFSGTSLRAITKEAGVNLAAVNYHFQSKEALIRELFALHVSPLNAERLRMLDEAEARAAGTPLPLGEIVAAFALPMLELRARYGDAVGILLGRAYAEPGDFFRTSVIPHMSEVGIRFRAAFSRALPHLPPEELYWRIHFLIGAVSQTLATRGVIETISQGACSSSDMDSARKYLIQYAVGALSAPSIQENA
jgi:AcrR family transcriptional regulator